MRAHHLRDVELVDIIDRGAVTAAVDEHVRGCATCRSRVEDYRTVLEATRDVEVPEPSPLFWEHFSRRVKDRIETGIEERGSTFDEWRTALAGWRRHVVAAALAVAVVGAAVLGIGRWFTMAGPVDQRARVGFESSPPAGGTVASEERAEWELLMLVADGITSDEAVEIGLFGGPGQIDRLLPDLSDDERRRLGELLHDELSSTES